MINTRRKDVMFGSHNPLCDYHHPFPHNSQASNSNSYTTINYNHSVQVVPGHWDQTMVLDK